MPYLLLRYQFNHVQYQQVSTFLREVKTSRYLYSLVCITTLDQAEILQYLIPSLYLYTASFNLISSLYNIFSKNLLLFQQPISINIYANENRYHYHIYHFYFTVYIKIRKQSSKHLAIFFKLFTCVIIFVFEQLYTV